MKRFLTLIATVGTFLWVNSTGLSVNGVINCNWGAWQWYSPPYPTVLPSVSILSLSTQTEPITMGQSQPINRSILMAITPGVKYRTDTCLNFQQGQWGANVYASNCTWQSSGSVPSMGILVNQCQNIYTATFVPPPQGGSITFNAKINPVDPILPQGIGIPGDGTVSALQITVPLNFLSPIRLGHWAFNDSTWIGDEGQSPTLAENIANSMNWNYGSLAIFPTRVITQPTTYFYSRITYGAYRSDGTPNITRNIGTVRFWYCPDWTSGTAGNTRKLLEMYNGQQSVWCLTVDAQGQNISLVTQVAGFGCVTPPVTNVTQPINWRAGNWYQIVVTYSTSINDVAIYVNGTQLGGIASNPLAYLENMVNSFSFGNGADGTTPATGLFDELETFNYVLAPAAIAVNYQNALALDTDNDGLTNFREVQIGTDPYNPDTDGDGVIDGLDCAPLNPNVWDCADPNDHTPPTIQLLQPINATQVQ